MTTIRHITVIALCIAAAACSRQEPDREIRYPDARPSEWAYLQRVYPHGNWNPDAYKQAYEAADRLQAVSKRGNSLGEWEQAGPTNIGGRVSDIEFDPQRPNIVYASGATGGLFKSTDTGETWTSIFDGYAVVNIGDIGISSSKPDVLYLGTGEANGSHNNLQGAGVFKSNDGGSTWYNVGLEETAAIGRIVVHPNSADVAYVAAVGSYFGPGPNRGVYRTLDGGDTWEQILFVSDTTGAIDLVMNRKNPDQLLAAMWHRYRRPTFGELSGPRSGIYRSEDGGDSWEKLGTQHGLPGLDSLVAGRIGLTQSQSDPDVVFAVYTDGSRYHGIYKTSDGGDNWSRFDPGNRVSGQFNGGFSWYFGQIRVSPTDTNRVYVMEVEFQHTRDGGETWRVIPGNSVLHVDHHALAFHPQNPEYIIGGNDGGINISEDGGLSWRKVRGLPITQFYEIEIDEQVPERLYGGTQDNQTVFTLTGDSDNWKTIEAPVFAGGDGFHVEVVHEPSGFTTIYAESQWGNIFKSLAGQPFQSLRNLMPDEMKQEPTNWNTPFVIDPSDPGVLYYGTNSLHRSPTRGTSWDRVSPPLAGPTQTSLLGTISTIAVSPTSPEAIAVGTDDGQVWVTEDTGGHWRSVSDNLPERWVTRVVFDPVEPNRLYVSYSGLKWRDPLSHVFATENLGESWTDISSNLPDAPVNALAVDPHDRETLYVGTDVGAFVSFDRGGSWEIMGEGLPPVAIYDLQVHPDPHFIVAGTHGRSMFRLELGGGAVTAIDDELPQTLEPAIRLHGNYPNPFGSQTTIRFELSRAAQTSVTIYDLMGRRLIELEDRYRVAGLHEIEWRPSGAGLSTGSYLYQVAVDGDASSSATGTVVFAPKR